MEQEQVVAGKQALSQDPSPPQRRIEAFLRRWLEGFLPPYLIRMLFQCLHKMVPWLHTMIPVETIGDQDSLCQHTKKRLGLLICFLLAFVPSRFQGIWRYLLLDTIAGHLIPEEIKKMLIKPSRHDSQRSQDILVQGDEQCWMEAIQGALPDDDDPADSTYEPTTSEYESEEYQSQNDTETELKTEEKDGVIMLKEELNQPDELRDLEEPRGLDSHSLGNGSEHSGNTVTSSREEGQALESQKQESMESCPTSEGLDTSLSSDSQEQWEDVSE